MYKKITAEFEVVTPMFIGDGSRKASSVRPSSIKGALRFWWRALNWEGIYRDLNNEAQALDELRRQEIALFGGVADKGNGGQGVASVRVVKQSISSFSKETKFSQGVKYLLGQGLSSRDALSPNSKFTLELILKKPSFEQLTQVETVIKVFGLIGGLGSRNRHGIGSVRATKLTTTDEVIAFPDNPSDYAEMLSNLLSGYKLNEMPLFTALSSLLFADISVEGDSWTYCLDTVGNSQQMYRSYGRSTDGRPHKVGRRDALQIFDGDHDLVLDVLNQSDKSGKHPERMVFGLPHNYYFSSGKRMNISGGEKEKSRRASPLFIHVHKFSCDKYAVVQMCIPAQFYFEGGDLSYARHRRDDTKRAFVSRDIDWQVIKDYMRLDEYRSKANSSSYPGFVSRTVIQEGLDHE